ncbi:MAG: 3-deoxy-manno-octulosonate cytidylyltransferase [Gammaproteobacteria bacterium WSBS_2016_MAG_OTU1]
MNFVAIVPARRGATRLPNKPLADIGGTPMIVHTLRRAAAANSIDAVFAAVDDQEIADVVRHAGFDAVMTGECDSGSARVAAAAAIRQLTEDTIVVNVQGDEPFIESNIVGDVAQLLATRPDCVCATAMRPLHNDEEFYNPAAVKVVANADNTARYFSRAPIPHWQNHSTPPPSARIHLGIYAYTMPFLQQIASLSPAPTETAESLEQLRLLWHGKSIALLETDSQSGGIDTPADLEAAQLRAKNESASGV